MNWMKIGIPALGVVLPLVAQHAKPSSSREVRDLKITILSTMLADDGIGEWGFSALVESGGRRLLVDTGARPETVLSNIRDLKIDLSNVEDVVLTHFHLDHTGGYVTLRREMQKRNPKALSRAHVATGMFWSRPQAGREANGMIAMREQLAAMGVSFAEHDQMAEIQPGVWLTGPVPRPNPERNYAKGWQVLKPRGLAEDDVPEDQSVVINTVEGLVVLTGCGHAGIVNILTDVNSAFSRPVKAVIGGLHLFDATGPQLDWTAAKLKGFGVEYLVGAHCTGIESAIRLRNSLGLNRRTAVVGGVGATFVLGEGIHPGRIAQ